MTMASFGPNFDLLSTEQIDAKLEDLDRQQVVVEEWLRTDGYDPLKQQNDVFASMYQLHPLLMIFGGGFPMAPAGPQGGSFMPNQFYPNQGFSNMANQASSSTSDESSDCDED
jgi:hypothetical protein